METQEFYTSREAAERMGCTLSGIHYLVAAGKLIPTKILIRNLFTEQEITRYEASRQRKPKHHMV